MQTDVKVGVVVGVVLAAVVIAYFVVSGTGPAGEEDQGLLGPNQPDRSDKVNRLVRNLPEPSAAPGRTEPKSEARPSEGKPAPSVASKRPSDTVIPSYSPSRQGKTEQAAQAPEVTGARKSKSTKPAAAKTAAPEPPVKDEVVEVALAPERSRPTEAAIVTKADKPDEMDTSRTRTYTVQPDDYGFWTVSEKVYGDGKYYHLIADANPDVTSASLRAGRELTIPPLPEAGEKPAAPRQPGRIASPKPDRPAATGRTYTVQAGDPGFWGVAKKVYGDGKYFYLIRQANPGVDTGKLMPGQKLIIPPKPPARPGGGILTVANAPAEPEPSPAARPGESGRTYTVVEGDAGFWGIAEKVYGNGRFFYLIRDANPQADSGKLMPGQKLTVPPLTAKARESVRETEEKHAAMPADNRPYFEEY